MITLRLTSPIRRWRLLAVGLAATCVFLVGVGSSAADQSTGPNPCPPGGIARQFCVTVADTDGVSRSPAAPAAPLYIEYEVTVDSFEISRTLQNVSLTATVVDLVGGSPATTAATLVSTTTDPPTSCGPLTAAGTISCTIGALRPGASWTGAFLMTASTNAAASATELTARVSANEQGNDSEDPDDANPEVQTAQNATVYATGTAGGTVVPRGIARHFSVPTPDSSLEFNSPGTITFGAFIQDLANDPSRCFPTVPCLLQTTQVGVEGGASIFGTANPLGWVRKISVAGTDVTTKSIVATHRLDPTPVTANAATDTFTSGKTFVNVDGVRFSTGVGGTLPAPLVADTDYLVRDGTATSFKVATLKGKVIDLTTAGTAPILAERVRIIGDTKSERAKSCAETESLVPSIFATAISSSVIQECVSDDENGYMK